MSARPCSPPTSASAPNRRHKPGRAFERTSYRFDVLTDYGAFRDLQRHRLLTIEWQPLTARHGYSEPDAIVEAGGQAEWRDVMDRSAETWMALSEAGLGEVAPYAVSMAYRVRFVMDMNAREAMHVIELRTAPQGHAAYRRGVSADAPADCGRGGASRGGPGNAVRGSLGRRARAVAGRAAARGAPRRAMTPLIEHRLSVRFRDCDGLGHVNNAVYLTYLEQARFALWRAQLSYPAPGPAGAAKRGVGFILARAEVDFVAQARFGDELAVRIALGEIGRSSCRLRVRDRRHHDGPDRGAREDGASMVRLRRGETVAD